MPLPDQRLAVGVPGLRRVAHGRRYVAIHQHLARDEPHRARACRLEDRVDRCLVRRREHHRRRRAVAQQFVQEEFRDLAGVVRVAEGGFGRKRVPLQPLQQLRAVGPDDVGLRVVDVRVDEAGDDQLAAIVGDGDIGRQRG
jgi:hypothetical protein